MSKTLLLVVALSCLLALAFAPPVRGEDVPEPERLDTWMFDVRLVRVDTPVPEAIETPAPWEATGSCTVGTAWPELLAQLKARGKTTLLLDQRVTALEGVEASITQTRDRQVEQLTSRDLKNSRYGVAPVVTGGTAKLRVQGAVRFQYELEARWEIRPEDDAARPLLCTTKWAGSYPAIADGRTLVLTYREQIDTWDGARVGTEIHAFLTMRRVNP